MGEGAVLATDEFMTCYVKRIRLLGLLSLRRIASKVLESRNLGQRALTTTLVPRNCCHQAPHQQCVVRCRYFLLHAKPIVPMPSKWLPITYAFTWIVSVAQPMHAILQRTIVKNSLCAAQHFRLLAEAGSESEDQDDDSS